MTQSKKNWQQSSKVLDIDISQPILVRRHCISRFPDSQVTIRCPSKYSALRISRGSYLWDCVSSGSIQITVPYSVCSLIEYNIPDGEGMIVNLDNLLAVTFNKFPKTMSSFDISSFIDGRHIFHHIEGPAYVAIFGAGEVLCENIVDTIQVKRGSIIAHSDTLLCGVGMCNSSIMHAISQSHILEDKVEGIGKVFRQTSNLSMNKIASTESKSRNSVLDYINAVVGVR